MTRKPWTKPEDQIVLENPKKTANQLTALLPGRTAYTISWRRSKLKSGSIKPSELINPEGDKAMPTHQKQHVDNGITPALIEKAEQLKAEKGTFSSKPTSDQIASAVTARLESVLSAPVQQSPAVPNPVHPILSDELTRLRVENGYLKGKIDGMQYVIDRLPK
jgi:hypothetical protein